MISTDCLLVAYGEIGLKGNNRREFERLLLRNIRSALPVGFELRTERPRGRILLTPGAGDARDLAHRIRDVFGIASLAPAARIPADPERIAAVAIDLVGRVLAAFPGDASIPFRVTTRRADKTYPQRTNDVNRDLGARLLAAHPRLKVRLDDARLDVHVEIRAGEAFLFTERLPGLGGLPVGSLGRVVAMLSGGIDSPVAAWLAMKRGCEVIFVHFHSQPFTGERSREKAVDLARRLARFQPATRIVLLPFSEVQKAIRDSTPEKYRTVLYRRMMQRIAARIAHSHGALGVVTGDNLGQVASQTLENLGCVEAASDLPLLRPVLTYEKTEIVALARRIGTYEISIRPYPDCCTLFQPANPVIRGKPDQADRAEEGLDIGKLVTQALEGAESLVLEASGEARVG